MGKIVWFTGLSGVGKTTIAKILNNELLKLNFKVKIIDGDTFRKKNKNNNIFSKTNIVKNNLSIISHVKEKKKNMILYWFQLFHPY